MTVVFTEDFESWNSNSWTVTATGSATFNADVASKKNGDYGGNMYQAAGGCGIVWCRKYIGTYNPLHYRTWFKIESGDIYTDDTIGLIRIVDSDGNGLFGLYLTKNADGKYRLYVNDYVGVSQELATHDLSIGTWYLVEIAFKKAVSGFYSVWLNHYNDYYNPTDTSARNNPHGLLFGDSYGSESSLAIRIYYDDMLAGDDPIGDGGDGMGGAIGETFTFEIGGVGAGDCVISAHYIKSHPNSDPDTFELRLVPECGETVNFFDTVTIKKNGVTEFVGFVEEITPEVGEDGLEYLISGRCWKLMVWKKWNERYQESREVGPEDTEGNIESGFFGAVKPEELVKFIMRCPISEHPKDYIRHKIGWGIASDYWDCCANVTADCYYPEWVALRYIGLAWRGRSGVETFYNDILPVNNFDSTFTDWDEYGVSPYLNVDSTAGRIHGFYHGWTEGDFDFQDLSAGREIIYDVYLYVKSCGYAKTLVKLYDGISWYNIGDLQITFAGGYEYKRFNVTSCLNTVTKVNNAKMRFEITGGVEHDPRKIIYAYLSIRSSAETSEPYQMTDDWFIVDMGKPFDNVTAMLIECRNNPITYARNYKIQYANLSNCCNTNNPPLESEWNDFTPAVNVTNNQARDILHSWEPKDDVRCIRIKLTMSDCNAWEISQIYIWEADEHKYRLMDEGD